ncbi:hypothetical protein BDY21DRAFT_341103 [Lineolata rhizophorae]|uniref:HMG box domain-containing protein n=1 Tax=Lineolata rhizophorae TaxID=578093 RepID=A0A6A6P3Y7_9PEZI|nr:hypothetical protein BDY21DRAFT_341103 [Lineolata rhizophorae]
MASQALVDDLSRLGLAHYVDTLHQHGFSSWRALLGITESDFQKMGFKLGHRRLLQREISKFRSVPSSPSLVNRGYSGDESMLQTDSAAQDETSQFSTQTDQNKDGQAKRRYRRHPKPDPNAPKRPKTGYVNFADHLRTDPTISSMPFADITKEVGRRWRELPQAEKLEWERKAAQAMQIYEFQMEAYRRTDQFKEYQNYLEDFRQQHSQTIRIKNDSSSGPSRQFISPDAPFPHKAALEHSQVDPLQTRNEESLDLTISTALDDLSHLRQRLLKEGGGICSQARPPPENAIRQRLHNFLESSGALVFVMSHEEVESMLYEIYRQGTPAGTFTFAEVMSLAAVGGRYGIDSIAEQSKISWCGSALTDVDEAMVKANYLRGMRLLLIVSFFCLLENDLVARHLITAGLQIARQKLPALEGDLEQKERDNWKKVYRSLMFVDGWLSYTLGYPSRISWEDTSYACSDSQAIPASIEDAVHWQVSQIGLVCVDIHKTFECTKRVTTDTVLYLSQRLAAWQDDLPPFMQLGNFANQTPPGSDLSDSRNRTILKVHMLYLGAVMLLYRNILLLSVELPGSAVKEPRSNATLSMPVEAIQKCRVECVFAARQIAQVQKLLHLDVYICHCCWILLYWLSSACSVLLFGISEKLARGDYDGILDEDFSATQICLGILEQCSADPAATKSFANLSPLHSRLFAIRTELCRIKMIALDPSIRAYAHSSEAMGPAMFGTSPVSLPNTSPQAVSIDHLLESPREQMSTKDGDSEFKAELKGISNRLLELLHDPFDRKDSLSEEETGKVRMSDGNYLVFWWQ